MITNGLIYINGEEREIAVSNISMTGVLIGLIDVSDTDSDFNDSLIATIIDFYLPQLRLAGTAEIVRITKEDAQFSFALQFKEISYNIDSLLYKRKVYRKNLSVSGRILLNSEYYYFRTINVSVEGLMIRLEETVVIAEGMITSFEFKDLSLKGEVKVVWLDFDADGKTLVGLKYINMNTDQIKGIPRFYIETD
ncbi:MAG: PilZ domain-containing protein [Methylococcaceae bacterium]|nr:PilZ domain-containing protein [Methylococcaceae bacterium]